MAETLWLLLFPYVPLSRAVDLGRWSLIPVRPFGGTWHSAWFRQRSMTIVRSHVNRAGQPLSLSSILVDKQTGADGVLPERDEIEAIQLAVGFGVNRRC